MDALNAAGPSAIVSEASRLHAKLLATVNDASAAALKGDSDASESVPEERLALLQSASTLISQLRAVSRRANDDVRRGKRKVADARGQVDAESLALQNLKYQQRHLEEEIRTCRNFQSIYQNIPLTEIDDFRARAPPESTSQEIWADPHRLQLARLQFELKERKRLEAEKAEVQALRASLVKENNVKKARLEGLEANLKEMLGSSTNVRQRFEEAEQADAAAEAAMTAQEAYTNGESKDSDMRTLEGTDATSGEHDASRLAAGGDDDEEHDDDDARSRTKQREAANETAGLASSTTTRTTTPAQTPRE